ncbi:MAG: glutathione S-transferase family protein [Candidatus Caenarcaniphilales bacterium]|nr:glutathione S-transferase family protein [Candidatus Caenarcaniphilales bacterium]
MTYVLEDTASSKIDQAVDVSSVRINLKYPTNNFELYTWEYCPVAYKILLALEYKAHAHKDIDFLQHSVPPHQVAQLQRKSGSQTPPYLKVVYKSSKEEAWINDQRQIIRLLDDDFPQNPLLHARQEGSLHSEVILLEDWLHESLLKPYLIFLYQNDLNFNKALKSWLGNNDKLINRARLKIFRQERLWQLNITLINQEQIYNQAFKRLDDEVFPIISERLEINQNRGMSFICGGEPSVADFTLYAFLRMLLSFEEANLVIRRPVLHTYIEAFEALPLLSNKGLIKTTSATEGRRIRDNTDTLGVRKVVLGRNR